MGPLHFYYDSIHQKVPSYTGKVEAHPDRQKLELLLELVYKPKQRFIERLILESFKDIKARHKQEMVKLILQHDLSPSDAIESMLSITGLGASAADAGRAFVELCRHLSSQDPHLVSKMIADHLNRNEDEIHPLIVSFLSQFGDLDPDDLIGGVCDRLMPEHVAPVADPRSVLFLTMHGSKGLTKKTVMLPGLEDSWLPGDSLGSELEEKKRLFYVALTRATDNLLITYPRTRARGDPLNYNAQGSGKVSHFVIRAGIPDVYHD